MIEIDEKNPLERAERARWRAGLYRSASAAFLSEPTDDELRALVEAASAALAEPGAWVLACEHDLLVDLAGYDAADEQLGTRVRTEYAELFVGPRPPLAPLYESLYVGSPRRMCTDVTRRVRDAYVRCGLQAEARDRVPDDHIGFELAFMAQLCDREADAASEGRFEDEDSSARQQGCFLVEHLGAWIGLLRARVEAAECGDYYRAWARFAESFVLEDARALDERTGVES